jgi:hypothetical protein
MSLVFPVTSRHVRRPSVLPPKAKPELLEAFAVRGRGVELCAVWLVHPSSASTPRP